LAAAAALSVSTINALVRRLEEEEYVERRGKGPTQTVHLLRPGDLLDSWAEYWRTVERVRHRYYGRYPSPDAAMQALARAGQHLTDQPSLFSPGPSAAVQSEGGLPASSQPPPVAFTGLAGASRVAPYVAFSTVELYVSVQPTRLAGEADLRPADEGPNVILLEPPDRTVLQGSSIRQHLPVVCLAQLYVDLIAAGGRAASEAAPLIRPLVLQGQQAPELARPASSPDRS
jgi:hypothetical protein